MAREALFAVIPGSTHSALYNSLHRREETAAQSPDGRVVMPSGQVYVGHESRLAAFRRGEPVRLRAWDVPAACLVGEDKRDFNSRRVIVYPDGTVEIVDMTDEDWFEDWGHL